jgi:hypothetical protein
MTTNRFHRLLIAVMMALLALAPFSAALASPPEFSTVPLDVPFPIAGCDFPVEGHLKGTLKVSVHLDQDGNFKMQIERVLQGTEFTYTNLDTGASFSSGSTGVDVLRIEEDGVLVISFMGNFSQVTVPGQGLVVQDVGRFILNTATGEITFSAGQFTLHGPGGDIQAFCAALE